MYVAQKSWHKRFATNLCNSKKREKIISSLSYYHTNSAWYVSCDFHFSSLQTFGGQGQTAGEFFIAKHFQSFLGGGGVGKVLLCHNFLKTSSPQDVINDRSLGIDKTKSFS